MLLKLDVLSLRRCSSRGCSPVEEVSPDAEVALALFSDQRPEATKPGGVEVFEAVDAWLPRASTVQELVLDAISSGGIGEDMATEFIAISSLLFCCWQRLYSILYLLKEIASAATIFFERRKPQTTKIVIELADTNFLTNFKNVSM
jgi:hypothetical protein